MSKSRLEAFSDGVMAIIITIMVLELRPPEEPTLEALARLWPTFVAYALSFAVVGIYWNNHHHLFQAVQRIDGRVLWANLGLLFALSLFPFGTAWMGDTGFAALPVAAYGVIAMAAAVSYFLLVRTLLRIQPPEARLAEAIGTDAKGRVSLVIVAIGVAAAFVAPLIAFAMYVVMALIWIIPDQRIERTIAR
jgi:uncharacterized membrane protein